MSEAGELVPRPALRGEVLPPQFPRSNAGSGGSVYADFANRLRGYVAPPPPGELGWQAVAGVGMTLGGAGLLALLPAAHTVATSGIFKWVGGSGLASMLDSAGALVEPLVLLALFVLVGIAVIYLVGWGATPALVFLTAQTWLGVGALAVATIAWVYLLFMFVLNLVIWVAYIVLIVGAVLLGLRILGLFLG